MKIRIKVTPNSKVEEVIKADDMFLVRVKEPPKEGKANRAVIKLLADYFGVPQGRIAIISGLSSRHKVVDVSN